MRAQRLDVPILMLTAVVVTPRSIHRCVATLRAKPEPDAHHPTYIQTIRDIGYRFEPTP